MPLEVNESEVFKDIVSANQVTIYLQAKQMEAMASEIKALEQEITDLSLRLSKYEKVMLRRRPSGVLPDSIPIRQAPEKDITGSGLNQGSDPNQKPNMPKRSGSLKKVK